jgi:hypothetical protein
MSNNQQHHQKSRKYGIDWKKGKKNFTVHQILFLLDEICSSLVNLLSLLLFPPPCLVPGTFCLFTLTLFHNMYTVSPLH